MITKTSELRKGDLIIWWSGNFPAYLQMFCTRRGYRYYDKHKRDGKTSHSSSVYSVEGETAKELNITRTVQLSNFTLDDKAIKYIYRPLVPEEVLSDAIDRYWEENKNKKYPYLQWLTYPSRWLFEIMFKYKVAPVFFYYPLPLGLIWHLMHDLKDPRQWGTVFPRRDVCSEGVPYDLFVNDICPAMLEIKESRFEKLLNRFKEWSGNKFHTTDTLVIYEDFIREFFDLIFIGPAAERNWKFITKCRSIKSKEINYKKNAT